ncbi:MAG TPA: glycosyltransferase family 4 protein [Anaerolineales bacterium]
MKILFVNYEYPPLGGGGGVMNAQIAQELAKRHDVTVLTSQGLGLPRANVENGVKVERVPVFFRKGQATANLHSMLAFIPFAISAGKKLARANSYDVINTHFVLPTGPVGDALSRFAGIPNVLTVHGGDLYDPSKFTSPHRHPLLRLWIRYLLRSADVVVGQSNNTLENVRHYYTPEIKGVRIPLGIFRPKDYSASRAQYGFAQDDILLVTVGRLIARKAVHQLIAMLSGLRTERAHLLVVGSGPAEDSLREEARARGLEHRVHFMGYIEEAEKFRLLGISDVYVSTAQHEGFCLAFLEAMACKLPIISYDHGGHMDYLKDEVTGFVVPLNNLELFTHRCARLIEEADLRQRFGANNLDLVEDYYIDSCASRYESEFYQAVAMKRHAHHVSWFQSSRPSTD